MMKQMMLVLSMAIAAPATAGPFDGTWIVDLGSDQPNSQPRTRNLSNGIFECTTCKPPISTPADGKVHPVAGNPEVDARSVKVIDARTVTMEDMKGGRSIGTTTWTVSPDGKSDMRLSKSVGANGKVVAEETLQQRLVPGPKGSHAMSGTWRDAKLAQANQAALTITIKESNGMLHVSYLTGESYDARIGGPAVPIKGDRTGAMASIRRTAPGTLVETDTLKGKVTGVSTMVIVNPSTMKVVTEDRQLGGVERFVAHKR